MLRLQRALLTELVVVFGFIALVVTGCVFLGSTVQLLGESGGALGSDIIVDLLPRLLPTAFAWSLPFAWLAAVALVMGRLSADQELTALSSAGVRMRTIGGPVVAMGAVLAVVAMAFNGYVVPTARRDMRSMLNEVLPRFLSSLGGAERSIHLNQLRMSFDRYENGVFHNVELDKRTDDGVLLAKFFAGRLRLVAAEQAGEGADLRLHLEDSLMLGAAQKGGVETTPSPTVSLPMGAVESIGFSTLFNDLLGAGPFEYKAKDMTLNELAYVDARGGVARASALLARTQFHGRLVLGASTLAFTLFTLGVMLVVPATGRRVRDFNLCFLPCMGVFFPLYVLGPTLTRSQGVPAWLAMWLPIFVLGGLGVALLLASRRR